MKPTPRQSQFLLATESSRFVFYGGAAGGGKSYILRWWLIYYLLNLAYDGVRGATVGLFCEDYPSLQDRQISKIETEFPDWLGTLRQGSTRDFTLHDCYGGGTISLRNLDDPSKYLSAEFAAIAVDELTKNEQSTFDFLRLRLRWPGVDKPRFAGASNPGGKGHGWVKALWIDRRFPKELEPLAHEFSFVPALATDNPHLSHSYWEQLQTLPEAMRKAYAEGSWDVFAGQYFETFGKHNVVQIKDAGMLDWWERWISIDWGYEHNSAVYWHAKSKDSATYTYREFVANRMGPRELGQRIAEMTRGEKVSSIFLGPDAYAKRTDDDTIAVQMGDALVSRGLPLPQRADNDRVGGWMLMHELLDCGLWKITENCTELIRSLPTLVRDESKPEDIEKVDGDDAADSARYGIKSRLGGTIKPLQDRVNERISANEPTSIMIWRSKFTKEELRKSAPFKFGHRRTVKQFLGNRHSLDRR